MHILHEQDTCLINVCAYVGTDNVSQVRDNGNSVRRELTGTEEDVSEDTIYTSIQVRKAFPCHDVIFSLL